jgi:hypothetical protein
MKSSSNILLALLCGLLIRSSLHAQGISYPREVDLTPFHPLKPLTADNWLTNKTERSFMVRLARTNFFNNGDQLSIECERRTFSEGSYTQIQLERNGVSNNQVAFPCDIGYLDGSFPAAFHDFDSNGFQDVKLVFYAGGNSGNCNNGQAYYFLQFEREWQLITFYLRDASYTWECDINGDGKYEILKGHHQDKEKPGYHDKKRDKWVSEVFRKYLFINAYSIEPNGLRLCNKLSPSLPKVLCFQDDDPFHVLKDKDFMKYNQFSFPDDYVFQVKRIGAW